MHKHLFIFILAILSLGFASVAERDAWLQKLNDQRPEKCIILPTLTVDVKIGDDGDGKAHGQISYEPESDGGVLCGLEEADCDGDMSRNRDMTFTATTNDDYEVIRWEGCEEVSKTECVIRYSSDREPESTEVIAYIKKKSEEEEEEEPSVAAAPGCSTTPLPTGETHSVSTQDGSTANVSSAHGRFDGFVTMSVGPKNGGRFAFDRTRQTARADFTFEYTGTGSALELGPVSSGFTSAFFSQAQVYAGETSGPSGSLVVKTNNHPEAHAFNNGQNSNIWYKNDPVISTRGGAQGYRLEASSGQTTSGIPHFMEKTVSGTASVVATPTETRIEMTYNVVFKIAVETLLTTIHSESGATFDYPPVQVVTKSGTFSDSFRKSSVTDCSPFEPNISIQFPGFNDGTSVNGTRDMSASVTGTYTVQDATDEEIENAVTAPSHNPGSSVF